MTRNLTLKQLSIGTGVAALLIVAIWYMALFKPETHKLAAARTADAAAKTQITGLQGQVASLRALEKAIPADTARLAQYQQAIPTGAHVSEAIRLVQAAAVRAGVTMGTLAPSVPTGPSASAGIQSVAGAQTMPVTIAATGSYGSLTAFVQALDAMPRTLVVKSISLAGTGNTMTESIAAEMYFVGH